VDSVERAWDHRVEIVAVTKGFEAGAIEFAVAAGCRSVGENYAQELISKREVIERLRPEVHFIGRLQSNKVRQLVGLVDVWASLDRRSIIDEVAKRADGARVLIQVNTTGEEGKGGCSPIDLAALVARVRDGGLRLDGLMTVGPTAEPPEAARVGFRIVRELVDEYGLSVCSMGMTADSRIAVEEGSTEIRVGTALFGQRPVKS
jgi:pyridoxal phosphate enzyme (YggS family)